MFSCILWWIERLHFQMYFLHNNPFSVFLSLDKNLIPEKRSCIILKTYFHYLLIFYLPKMKYKDGGEGGGFIFLQKLKIKRSEKENKYISQLFHFRNSYFFLYGLYQKMLNVSPERSFKNFAKFTGKKLFWSLFLSSWLLKGLQHYSNAVYYVFSYGNHVGLSLPQLLLRLTHWKRRWSVHFHHL